MFQKLAKSIPMDWASAYREGGADEGRVRAQPAEHGLWIKQLTQADKG